MLAWFSVLSWQVIAKCMERWLMAKMLQDFVWDMILMCVCVQVIPI